MTNQDRAWNDAAAAFYFAWLVREGHINRRTRKAWNMQKGVVNRKLSPTAFLQKYCSENVLLQYLTRDAVDFTNKTYEAYVEGLRDSYLAKEADEYVDSWENADRAGRLLDRFWKQKEQEDEARGGKLLALLLVVAAIAIGPFTSIWLSVGMLICEAMILGVLYVFNLAIKKRGWRKSWFYTFAQFSSFGIVLDLIPNF